MYLMAVLPSLLTRVAAVQYGQFPQVLHQPWCPGSWKPIESRADCDHASQVLELTQYGPTSIAVESAQLPSCMIADMGLRWNKYGLLDKNMTTSSWLGFIAICKMDCPNETYAKFPQVWGETWCRPASKWQQITSQDDCDCASEALGLTQYGRSNARVESATLPSCMIADMGLRWNKYGLLDTDMKTTSWLGFTAICKEAAGPEICPAWVGRDDFGKCSLPHFEGTDYGACHADIRLLHSLMTQCIPTREQYSRYVCPEKTPLKCSFGQGAQDGDTVCDEWVGDTFGLCDGSVFGACHADWSTVSPLITKCIHAEGDFPGYTCPREVSEKCVFSPTDATLVV
jgi:hypothetical protein